MVGLGYIRQDKTTKRYRIGRPLSAPAASALDELEMANGEFNPEVRCIAVPVKDFSGQSVGALGISGPIWRLSDQTLKVGTEILQRAATQLSTEFGARAS